MKYFFDTEFAASVRADGSTEIKPISLGIAAADGREYYAEFAGAYDTANSQDWLRANVLPHLKAKGGPDGIARRTGTTREKLSAEIARDVERFCASEPPVWVAGYGGFDWVILSSLWGGMMAMPKGWPYHFVEAEEHNLPRVERSGAEHNALGDAVTLRRAWQAKYGGYIPPIRLGSTQPHAVVACNCMNGAR